MTAYKLAIRQDHDHAPPVAEIYTECTAAGCTARYLMPEPSMPLADYPPGWLDANRPRWDDIQLWAARRGWTYTDEHGPRCGEHPYGTPVAAIESHEAAQVTTDTAEIDVAAVKAALEEGEDDDPA